MPTSTDQGEEEQAEEPQLFRLTDIVTREVSVVDRAANQRKFLLVKRSGDMANKKREVQVGKDGELESKPEPNGTEAQPGGDKGDNGGAETQPAMRLAKADKEKLEQAVAKGLEVLGAVKERLAKAEEPAEGEEPSEQAEVVSSLTEAVSAMADAIPGEEATEAVEKAGRKMASARLRQFEAAYKLLGKLLGEVRGAQAPEETDEKSETTKSEEPIDVSKLIEDSVAKAFDAGMGQLVETVGELAEKVTKSESELAEIKRARIVSAQVDTDGEGTRSSTAKNQEKKRPDTGWRLDLNKSEPVPEHRNFD